MLMKSHRRLAARRGFTLMEVMLVAAILLILAGVATVAVSGYMGQAKKSEAKIEMQKIVKAAETFHVNYGEWPQSCQMLIQPYQGDPPLVPGGADDITDPWGQPYQLVIRPDQYGSERATVDSSGPGGTSKFSIPTS